MDSLSQRKSDERIVGKDEPWDQRRADVIGKLQGCSSGTTLATIDGHKVWRDTRVVHRLAKGNEFAAFANAQL